MPTPSQHNDVAPLIFIAGDIGNGARAAQLGCPAAYAEAVAGAGGMPVVLPPLGDCTRAASVLVHCDGLLFTGGADLTADSFGGTPHPETKPVSPTRQQWDLTLMRVALNLDELPILAICLGIQELNVACGGTLHPHVPDLPAAGEHRRLDKKERYHPVAMVQDSRLADILGKTDITANTSHHQAIERVGNGLRIAARAPDGVIEAVELEKPGDRFILGVQWHPERIADRRPHGRIFTAFVMACRAYAANRKSRSARTPLPRQLVQTSAQDSPRPDGTAEPQFGRTGKPGQ